MRLSAAGHVAGARLGLGQWRHDCVDSWFGFKGEEEVSAIVPGKYRVSMFLCCFAWL